MAGRINRIGETNKATNGQMMTIIAYRGFNDIDVQFEDDTIVYHKNYGCFKKGTIANPNFTKVLGINKVGETNRATNGQMMTIIAYRNYDDIDVQFDDGTIVTNKNYGCFKKGNITNPNFTKVLGINKIGETNRATNGQMMTIIAYRGNKDIDVQFEDGTIVTNKSYYCFKIGQITNHNFTRVGETNRANNGQIMTIIAYRGCEDIDIQFEDGTIVYHKAYHSFKKGQIANPNFINNGISFPEFFISYFLKQIGFEKYPKGYYKKFDKAFGRKEFDCFLEKLLIAFEYDGFRWHKDMLKDLGKNSLCIKNGIFLIRVREKGLPLLNTEGCYEIQRESDNYEELIDIVNHIVSFINKKFQTNFSINVSVNDIEKIKKEFTNCYYNFNKHIGETNRANNGQMMTIIAYRGSKDIDVQFDDGTIVTNKSYDSFKKGQIANPNFFNKTGETNRANNGQIMTIIAYRNINDIDVQFEDGTIVTHKTYQSFKMGKIANPNFTKVLGINKVGEINRANNGQIMTIIAYRGANDIDVQFEDGTIVTHKTYQSFKMGNIANPNFTRILIIDRTGETNKATNGQMMTIIAYRSSKDIDVQFEDGTIVTNKSYTNFKLGTIANPNFIKIKKSA